METITFRVTRVVFERDGFHILAGTCAASGDKVKAKGKLDGLVAAGDEVTAEGEWKEDPKWGRDFSWVSASVTPNNREGFVSWAVERLPGIGERRAEALWGTLGGSVWSAMRDRDLSALTGAGLTAALATDACEAYARHRDEAEQVGPLTSWGLGLADAKACVRHFGGRAVATLQEDPYELCAARGVTFDKVDAPARRKHGVAKNDLRRLQGIAVDAIRRHMADTGDTRVKQFRLSRAVRDAGNAEALDGALSSLRRVQVLGDGYYALTTVARAEQLIADFIG